MSSGNTSRVPRRFRFAGMALAIAAVASLGPTLNAWGAIVVARNGMVIEGKLGYLPNVDENPLATNSGDGVNQVVLLDDGLRRTYLPSRQVGSTAESDPTGFERIRIRQNVASGRRAIGSVTSIRSIGAFDDYGRRVFSILTPRGPEDIFQGITEITPVYTRLQGLSGNPSIRWDCRVATSSIPRETLSKVLRLQGVKHGADARLAAVRLMFEAERYRDARIELEEAMREYPELAELDNLLVQLKQYSAQRLIDEIELREAAGQHRRAESLLSKFPERGVAPEALQRVSEVLRQLKRRQAEIERLKRDFQRLSATITDPTLGPQIKTVGEELEQRLNLNSAVRLQDYQRLQDDAKMTDETRLSLMVSGWVLGSGSATQNLAEALSAIRARDLVHRYLRSVDPAERDEILIHLGREEAGSPRRLAEILKQLRPPLAPDPQPDRPPGNFQFSIDGVPDGRFVYEVQLPDEYDPYRRYPTVVTLHARGRSASDQIDWWAGGYDAQRQMRLGQAMRHGYIVVAPHWLPEGQRTYQYSGREHAAVLSCLRDAGRRFSIDSDRVYLSGHSIGGDAAWDIGLAHPDLWAGVIPIVAVADYGSNAPKYVSQYWPNVRHVPLYFVMGELDGNKLELNRRDFNRYMRMPGLDVMITEYIGRGHEHFFEEIHRIFEWMSLHRRDHQPLEYQCMSMRTFDNFFFNLELNQLPALSMVNPFDWPATATPAENRLTKTAVGTLIIKTGAVEATLWLSPDLVDLDGRLAINVNGRTRAYEVVPDSRTLLEDARTRVDRQHPFWARVELITGKRATTR